MTDRQFKNYRDSHKIRVWKSRQGWHAMQQGNPAYITNVTALGAVRALAELIGIEEKP